MIIPAPHEPTARVIPAHPVGISGAGIQIGTVELKGMALAAIVGVALSLIFWLFDKLGVLNKES